MKFVRILLLCALAEACFGSEFADRLFKEAQKAERGGDTLHAYLLYARAAALDPSNVTFLAHKTALQGIAAMSARQELGPDPAAAPELTDEIGSPSTRDLLDARQPLPPPRLNPAPGKKSFDLKGDPRTIFEKVAEAFGIIVVFEADYQSPPNFTFRMTDVDFTEAMRAVETVANSFLVPVNERLALVMRDSPQKRTERMPTMSVTIPLPERMSIQEATEIIIAVQQTLDIRHVVTDPARRIIMMRDQATKVNTARQMFYNLSRLRPQVEVDVEFLSVDKTSSLGYGMNLPNQLSVVNFQGLTSLPGAIRTIERITGPSALFALGITQASAFATLSKASASNLLRAQIVSLDGQAATLHVGARYPIITNQYVGNTGGVGQVFTPPPTINYEDLGLVLKITPSLHLGDEVTLDVDSEFKTLGAASSISGIPIISSRKYTGKVRLKNGEWGVIAGLVATVDSDNRTGYPGLMRVPFLGRLFSQNNIEHDRSEILIVLKPHSISLPPWETVAPSIWIGTETRPLTVY